MRTRLKNWLYKAALLLSATTLVACASSSPLQPPEIVREVQLTPLPATVRSLGLKPSGDWQARVQSYLQRVEEFSSSATSTCSGCGGK